MPRRTEYPRDCPRCGASTTVTVPDKGTNVRECDAADCPWWLYKGTVYR